MNTVFWEKTEPDTYKIYNLREAFIEYSENMSIIIKYYFK